MRDYRQAAPSWRRLLGRGVAAVILLGGLNGLAAPRAEAASSQSLICWGYDQAAQCEIPDSISDVVAISAGDMNSAVLQSDGTVVAWGDTWNGINTPPAGLTDVEAISLGNDHALALKTDGSVVGWGANWQGQTDVPAGLQDVVAVDAGVAYSLALEADGTVVAWGYNSFGQTNVPAGLKDVVAVSAGDGQSLALKSDGSVVAWGNDSWGKATVPSGLAGVAAISAGNNQNLALRSDGTVVAWGANHFGQSTVPKGLHGVAAISSGGEYNLALKSDGSVVAWGNNDYYQSWVPPRLGQVTAIAAGSAHNLVLGQILRSWSSTPTPKVSDTTPRVGQKIQAKTGTWKPATDGFTYQWYRGSTPIDGASGSEYAVGLEDLGARLKVQVTGSKDGYNPVTKTSALTAKVAKGVLSPAPEPAINDTTPTVDQTVAAEPGVWGPDPVGLAYQWYRVNSRGTNYKIAGGTDASYTPTGTDAGYRLRIRVTGTKEGYTTKAMTSNLTGKVAKASFSVTPPPNLVVEGTARVGKTLTAKPGSYTPGATQFSFQWYRGTARIRGATKPGYTLGGADRGKMIRARVSAVRTGYVTNTQNTEVVGPIQAGLPAPAAPRLDDITPVVDQTLTITKTVCPTEASDPPGYQWYRGSKPIEGANRATYAVAPADVGATLKIMVACSAPDYAQVTATSAVTRVVAKAGFTSKGTVTITGTLQVGQVLTAEEGTWVPSPDSYGYQWYRNVTAVNGATARTFTPTSAGAYTVKVIATRAGYTNTTAASSPATVTTP